MNEHVLSQTLTQAHSLFSHVLHHLPHWFLITGQQLRAPICMQCSGKVVLRFLVIFQRTVLLTTKGSKPTAVLSAFLIGCNGARRCISNGKQVSTRKATLPSIGVQRIIALASSAFLRCCMGTNGPITIEGRFAPIR